MRPAAVIGALAAVLLSFTLSRPANALPTMIRLGYPNCASCHISPQGGGLLNAYGRGIDQAQSLRGGEYQPSQNGIVRSLSWGGRITQDVRSVMLERVSTNTNQPVLGTMRARFMYRNATELGKGFRLTATFGVENRAAMRPSLGYDPPIRPDSGYVSTALLSYRPRNNVEFAVGRDQLPSGLNLPDLSMLIRSRNRMGYYDTPTQVKMFLWGARYQIVPYAFAPGGNEPDGQKESGGGALAEFDLLGNGRTVVGVNVLHGTARLGNRTMAGPYARLGFGRWGIFAEHDITTHKIVRETSTPSFRQSASYAEVFYAIREWLVASVGAERLRVQNPYEESLYATRFGISARLSSQVTIGISSGIQRNVIKDQTAPSVALQLAIKTVN